LGWIAGGIAGKGERILSQPRLFRPARDAGCLAAGEIVHLSARPNKAAGEKLVLHVGRVEAGTGAHEQADRRRPHHQRSAAGQRIF
jgi:hypothetical protein